MLSYRRFKVISKATTGSESLNLLVAFQADIATVDVEQFSMDRAELIKREVQQFLR